MEKLFNNIKTNGEKVIPEVIVEDYFKELSELTNGRVFGKVELFESCISTLTNEPKPVFDGVFKTKGSLPQDFLGFVGDNKIKTYELFITGKITNKYKYRFAFIEYEAFPYPVKLSLDRDIAAEINISENTQIYKEEEYRNIIINILNSKKITGVINGLLEIN